MLNEIQTPSNYDAPKHFESAETERIIWLLATEALSLRK